MSKFKKILVPIDGSATSRTALDTALEIARDAGGSLRLVHSVDELANLGSQEYGSLFMERMREEAARVLNDGLDICKSSGVEADSQLIDLPGQRLGETVAEEARKWQADLIVVGTHGRRGLGRVLLGSGAEQIIRQSPVPVLTIRGQNKSD